MPRRYVVLDVFTTRLLEGNPLAIVLDAEGLDGAAMQRIAGEFNLSETVFVQPPDNPAHTAKIRIFTPARELPFAGHPTVGTAAFLAEQRFAERGMAMDAVIVLEETVGPVRCAVGLAPDRPTYAEFDVPRLAERVDIDFGGRAEIAEALNLNPHDIGFENHDPSRWSAGVPYAFVPVKDIAAMRDAKPNTAAWRDAFLVEGTSAFVYCRETLFHDSRFHARMFGPEFGIVEDPATGSAVAAFAGLVNAFDDLPNGAHRYRIEQGFEMGRASLIDLEVEVMNGALVASRIGGHAVKMTEGTLFL